MSIAVTHVRYLCYMPSVQVNYIGIDLELFQRSEKEISLRQFVSGSVPALIEIITIDSRQCCKPNVQF